MYAIVDISGEQFRVEKGDELKVPHQRVEPGKKVTYDQVLLLHDSKKVMVGTPIVSSTTVEATVVEHGKTRKVPVFKKKRRKGYRVKNTHRQGFTIIRIDTIKNKAGGKSKSSTTKKKPTAKKIKVAEGE